MISDNASTYLAAAEEIRKLLDSDILKEALGLQHVTLDFHSKASTMVWGVLGEIDRLN